MWQHQNTDMSEGHFETGGTYNLSYTYTFFFKKKKEWWRKQDTWSKSLKPLKKHYVQHGKSLTGGCVTIFFKTKLDEQHHRTTLTTRTGSDAGVGGASRATCDMCMCAKLYQYHNKSIILQCLLLSKGRGRQVSMLRAGIGLVEGFFFCLFLFVFLGGVGVRVTWIK